MVLLLTPSQAAAELGIELARQMPSDVLAVLGATGEEVRP
jgi:hypothetical protein